MKKKICLFSNHLTRIRVNPDFLLPKWLLYYFRLSWSQGVFERMSTKWINQAGINQTKLKKLPILFSPIKTQRTIIKKLDKIFEKLDEKLQQISDFQMKIYSYEDLIYQLKQTLLQSAFEGKFTKEWRKTHLDIESGLELLEKAQKNKKHQFESTKSKKNKEKKKGKTHEITILGKHPLIPSWVIAKLENIVYIAGRIGWKGLTTREYTSEGPLLLSVYSLNYGDEVDYTDAKHISWKRYEESPEIQLQENDILLTKDGSGIGKIAFVKNLSQPATVNSSLLVVRSMDVFNPKFLFYLLSGPAVQKLVRERIDIATIPHLYQRDIKNFILLVPPLAEQSEIVNILESKLNMVLKLQNQVETINQLKNSMISNLNLFHRSILEQAFLGKLVN